MTEWASRNIHIWTGHVEEDPRPRLILADAFGAYAVHMTHGITEGWTVTHVPSGLSLHKGTDANQARHLAEWLHRQDRLPTEVGHSWGSPSARQAVLTWVETNGDTARGLGDAMRSEAAAYEARQGQAQGQPI